MISTGLAPFDEACDRVLGHEGGYTPGGGDPGGETRWGISKRSYPDVDIRSLTRDQAVAIYRRDVWDRLMADTLPAGLRFQLFDFAVNSGIETAIRALQRAIDVADDGHWGPVSQAAVRMWSGSDLVLLLSAERLEYMTRCRNWSTAGKGWARRMAANLRDGALDT